MKLAAIIFTFFSLALCMPMPVMRDIPTIITLDQPNFTINVDYGLVNVSICGEQYCTYANYCRLYRTCDSNELQLVITAAYIEDNGYELIIDYDATNNCTIDVLTDILMILLTFALLGLMVMALFACIVWLKKHRHNVAIQNREMQL